MSWSVGERKNGKERRGRCQASHLPFLYPGYQKSKETPAPLSPLRFTGLRFSRGPTRYPAWKEGRNSRGVTEIPEITPQIKTFYQPLIAVQTNYILAKPCQRLPRGIIIKFWAWKCVPILSTSGCFSYGNGAPDHFSFHDVLCVHVAFAGWWGGRTAERVQLYLKAHRGVLPACHHISDAGAEVWEGSVFFLSQILRSCCRES